MKPLDLNTMTPEGSEQVLRDAAQQYCESASELASTWQDNQAGAIWNDYAAILERAADSMARARTRRRI